MDRASPGPRPRTPRPRRSMPLRGTDIVEAGVIVLLAVLGIVGLLAAVLVGDDVRERALTRTGEYATQHDEAGQPVPKLPRSRALVDQGDRLSAPVSTDRSRAGDGDSQGLTEVTPLPPSSRSTSRPGDRIDGVAAGPRRSLSAFTLAVWSVALALAGVLFLLWLAWLVVTRGTAAHNSQRWARDWAAVEPVWSGRGPRDPGEPTDRP